MYRCAKCNKPIQETNTMGVQCDKCGSRIFIKERPNVKKTLKSD